MVAAIQHFFKLQT